MVDDMASKQQSGALQKMIFTHYSTDLMLVASISMLLMNTSMERKPDCFLQVIWSHSVHLQASGDLNYLKHLSLSSIATVLRPNSAQPRRCRCDVHVPLPSKLPQTTLNANALLVARDRTKTAKYDTRLGHQQDPIHFSAFSTTTAGLLSPSAHALIRQRASARVIPECDLERILVIRSLVLSMKV